MALGPGNVQRRLAVTVGHGTIGSFVEQDGHNVCVAVERGQLERSPAFVVRVNVDPVLQQRADGVRLAVAHRQVKRVPALVTGNFTLRKRAPGPLPLEGDRARALRGKQIMK